MEYQQARSTWKKDRTMAELFQPTQLIVVAVVAFVFFGSKKIPEFGRGLGKGLREFRDGIKSFSDDSASPRNTTVPASDSEASTH
jgi:sec-independent protein translocase protein TatA